jgi:hypothetical protein
MCVCICFSHSLSFPFYFHLSYNNNNINNYYYYYYYCSSVLSPCCCHCWLAGWLQGRAVSSLVASEAEAMRWQAGSQAGNKSWKFFEQNIN